MTNEKIVIVVTASNFDGIQFQIEQKEGDLTLAEVAKILGYAAQYIYEQFPYLNKGEDDE